jgi:hypothetical protein
MNEPIKDKIYLNLIPNVNKKPGDNLPVMVAPNSPKAPEGKNWQMNVNIGGSWFSYAAFDGTDIEGNPTGGYTIILTKKDAAQATAGANKQPGFKAGGFQKKAFTSGKSFGNRQY